MNLNDDEDYLNDDEDLSAYDLAMKYQKRYDDANAIAMKRFKMEGLTNDEKQNEMIVEEYTNNFLNRRDQAREKIPQDLSPAYKIALQTRYQNLRDLSESCTNQVLNGGYGWRQKSVFIEQCEKKKFEIDSEMLMLELSYPFLSLVSFWSGNDI